MIKVALYNSNLKTVWNEIISDSINGTFILFRDYLEYHKERFKEVSLVFYYNELPIALLPIEYSDRTLFSYRGLTYGGWVFRKGTTKKLQLELIEEGLKFLSKLNFQSLMIKPVPEFLFPTSELVNEEVYPNAGFIKTEDIVYHVLKLPVSGFGQKKRWGRKKGLESGLIIKSDDDFERFWKSVLIPNLELKYKTKPVHSFDEMFYLKSNFPEFIKLFNVYFDNCVVAGCVFYIKGKIWHAQYIASTLLGRSLGALDFLFTELVFQQNQEIKLISLGTSISPETNFPNQGLVRWKESLKAVPTISNCFKFSF